LLLILTCNRECFEINKSALSTAALEEGT